MRTRVHVLCGLLWSVAVWQMAAFADHAGAPRETLLLMTVGAAVICLFFTAPSLPSLLVVGPIAMAGPLTALLVAAADLGRRPRPPGAAFALASMLSPDPQPQPAPPVPAGRRARAAGARAHRLAGGGRAPRPLEVGADRHAEPRDPQRPDRRRPRARRRRRPGRPPAAVARTVGRRAGRRQRPDRRAERHARHRDRRGRPPDGRLARRSTRCGMVRELTLTARPQAAAKGLELHVFVEPALEGRRAGAALADAGAGAPGARPTSQQRGEVHGARPHRGARRAPRRRIGWPSPSPTPDQASRPRSWKRRSSPSSASSAPPPACRAPASASRSPSAWWR